MQLQLPPPQACHAPSDQAQTTAALAALFLLALLSAAAINPSNQLYKQRLLRPSYAGTWAWAKTLARCFVRRNLFCRLDPTFTWAEGINTAPNEIAL